VSTSNTDWRYFIYETGDTNRHIIQLIVYDTVGNYSKATAVLTRPTAAIDFKQGGEGVAIGTYSDKNGFTVEMPTFVGEGLKPVTEHVNRRIWLVEKLMSEGTAEHDSDPIALIEGQTIAISYMSVDGISMQIDYNLDTASYQGTQFYLDPPGKYPDTTMIDTLTQSDNTTTTINPIENVSVGEIGYRIFDQEEWVDISKPQLIVGRYNIPVEGALLIIGNGTDNSHRSNSLVIDKDGNFESKTYDDLVVNNLLVKGRARVVNGTLLGGVYSSATVTLPVSGWSDNTQSIEVTGVTASNIVMVTPAPNSAAVWSSGGVICSGQGQDTLSFSCEVVPTSDIVVNVVIL
jgi:hypothetical protein